MAGIALFSTSLIDQSVHDALPEGYEIRPLARDDYRKGFFDCLESLTWTGQVTEAQFHERFDWLTSKGSEWFYNVVIEHTAENKIVGTGVLICDHKFIWNLGMVGHIEDVSILEPYQGKGLGKILIQALDCIGRNLRCLKNILNCDEDHEGFYEKCGYEKSSAEMKHEFEGSKTP